MKRRVDNTFCGTDMLKKDFLFALSFSQTEGRHEAV